MCPSLLLSLILRQGLTAKDRYPNHISSETSVPAWAYLDVVTTDRFEAVNASQSTTLAESTVGNNEMSTTSSTSPSSSDTSTSPSNTTTIGVYAIIGIAVGCTVGFGLAIGLALYIWKKGMPRLLSSAFSRRRATPDMGIAAARHPNILLPSGQSSLNYGQRGRPPPVTLSRYDPTNGSPWSPPPTSSTPSRTMSPTSSRSLLSAHNYGSRPRHGDDSMNYRTSSSGPSTGDSSENPGNRSSMLYVRTQQANRGHELTTPIQVDGSPNEV